MLSCYLIAKNAEDTLERGLKSVHGLVDEIILIDDGSTDKTAAIATANGATVIPLANPSEGYKRKRGLEACRGDWILVLDTDEEVPADLAQEIRAIITGHETTADLHDKQNAAPQNTVPTAFEIPFRNHFLGRPLAHGGEYYTQLRLFRNSAVDVVDTPIHSFYKAREGAFVGTTSSKLNHFSYRSLAQLYTKFNSYAQREASRKAAAGESTGLKKLTLYPLHMFWARFVEDGGYKDGLFRVPLDVAFAYMEFKTYWNMLFLPKSNALLSRSHDARHKGGSW